MSRFPALTNFAAVIAALGFHDSPMPTPKTPAGFGRMHRLQVAAAKVQPGITLRLDGKPSRQVQRREAILFARRVRHPIGYALAAFKPYGQAAGASA